MKCFLKVLYMSRYFIRVLIKLTLYDPFINQSRCNFFL
ncbi:hypothetical protein WP2S18C03_25060 [Aeromonas veronii]|nr:hypothetical protein WP2S18C03_25060 [Aeromonas veronii]